MTDINVEKANEKSFFDKNMIFKNLFQLLLTKVSSGDQCPRPLSYDDIQEGKSTDISNFTEYLNRNNVT